MSRVLVAMSGGVDSSVAALLLVEAGHEVTGATLRLWGGESDTGCCSLADVNDARRVCDALGIDHFVFDLTEEFENHVVAPYVAAHAAGRTPNPCAACNRHIKFDALVDKARRLGFERLATGHHARIDRLGTGHAALVRGADRAKDQSYVLAMLGPEVLDAIDLPVGELQKSEVRALAGRAGLRVAQKPDSQDVCFIGGRHDGRAAFLADRIALHSGSVVDASSGESLGEVPALELLTVGQRRGVGLASGERRYVVELDVARREVRLGSAAELETRALDIATLTTTGEELLAGRRVLVQSSAHGAARPGVLGDGSVELEVAVRKVAPGQLLAFYEGERVLGSAVVR
jgi:tRNA-uridine 2-sulfurtransferase